MSCAEKKIRSAMDHHIQWWFIGGSLHISKPDIWVSMVTLPCRTVTAVDAGRVSGMAGRRRAPPSDAGRSMAIATCMYRRYYVTLWEEDFFCILCKVTSVLHSIVQIYMGILIISCGYVRDLPEEYSK